MTRLHSDGECREARATVDEGAIPAAGGTQRAVLAAMFGSITAVGVTLGLSTPLFSVVLDRMGLSASMVGFNTSVGVGATLS